MLTRRSRAGAGLAGVEQFHGHEALQYHKAHAVGDQVVQFAGNALAFIGDDLAGVVVAPVLYLDGPFFEFLRVMLLGAERSARHPVDDNDVPKKRDVRPARDPGVSQVVNGHARECHSEADTGWPGVAVAGDGIEGDQHRKIPAEAFGSPHRQDLDGASRHHDSQDRHGGTASP